MLVSTAPNKTNQRFTTSKAYDWISRIIETCNNDFHFTAVDALIELYFHQVQDEQKYLELKIMRQDKWNDIHCILQ